MSPAVWIGLISLVLLLFLATTRALRDPLNRIPGPFYTRFTHLPLKAAVISGRRIQYVHALHEKYGRFVRIAPNEIAIADREATKQIHSVNDGFDKSPWYQDFANLPRHGIFTMCDSRSHAARRRLLSRAFSKTQLRQYWEAVVQEKVGLAISRIREEASNGYVDVMKWFTFMASDVSSHLMFGESFRTLERGEVSDYIRTLQKVMVGDGIGAELPFLRWIGKRLPFKFFQDLWGAHGFLMDYAQIAVANMKASQGSKNVFANMMAEAEKGEKLDDIDVKCEALGLIIAGTDTTSISLTYLVWAVLSRPALQRRLEEEVETLPENFRDADVEQLKLLNAVVEETLRLYGAAPGGLPRIVPVGGATMGGVFIPEGTTVTTQAYTSHRDASLFPDPLQYVPERWSAFTNENSYRVSDVAKTIHAPFGHGSRICLGIHLAYMELRLATATFFRVCAGAQLSPSTTPKTMEMENFFLISPVGHKCEVVLA
ncbi:MAG: hypothetical protein M1820_007219 [Bogoriella megaspora]|nr:MAG: hypothetical protein M1820_007219 [Bogoriella megaspora]